MNIFEEINKRILLADGAMGTQLIKNGLTEGICPESFNTEKPEIIINIAKLYKEAGSDIISTNTFGGNIFKLKEFDRENFAEEYNSKGVSLAKSVMRNDGFVFSSCGTTGQIVTEEGGFASCDDLYNAFAEQISAQAEGGADGILIETQYSKYEASAAIKAAKENTSLPVICTFSFEKGRRGYRTMMGLSVENAIKTALDSGADIIGSNCGNGIENMVEICREIRSITDRPILINSNAGLPVLENGITVYKEDPEYMASFVPALIEAGANIIGGCCGTSPEHIKAMKNRLALL